MRVFLQYILPLAFPMALYLLWKLSKMKRTPADEREAVDWKNEPWLKLFAAGIVLTALSLVTFNALDGEKPGGVYQSPVLKDGKVVPGHVIRDE